MSNKLVDAIIDMRESDALELVMEQLNSGTDPKEILDDGRRAMEIIGQRFERGEFFLPELTLGGEILKQISELVKPRLKQDNISKKHGKVVIGTVKDDIHDIGKDIVVFMLDLNGFDVIDLGVDVPSERFVETIAAVKPDVIALSGLLTIAFDSMKNTVEAIKAAGMRDSVKIIVGGGPVDDQVRVYSGADAYGADAMAAVKFAKTWIGEKRDVRNAC